MELKLDHVMFPIFFNDAMLEFIEEDWQLRKGGSVIKRPFNGTFSAVYLQSKSFYVEYLSTADSQPYWSNAIYLVVPKQYWDAYENPAMRNEHFLIPYFGSGYQLVSPDFPHLNTKVAKDEQYDGLTVLISKALEQEITNIGGKKWTLPANGKIRVHDGLHHLHDISVIDEHPHLIAPIFEANPVLRDFF